MKKTKKNPKKPKRNRNSLTQRSSAAAGLIGQWTGGTEMGNNFGSKDQWPGKGKDSLGEEAEWEKLPLIKEMRTRSLR